MLRIVLSRLIQAVPTLIGITLLAVMLIPEGNLGVLLGGQHADQATIDAMLAERGMDLPWHASYTHNIVTLAKGELRSSGSQDLVMPILFKCFGMTAILAISAMLLASLLGLVTGCAAAWNRGGLLDRLLMSSAISGVSVPVFIFAFLLIGLFSIKLRWLPLAYERGEAGLLPYLVLPAATLGLRSAGYLSRMVRSTLLEVLGEDYVLYARAKGLAGSTVFLKHALRNALLPIVTIIGLDLGSYLAGSLITETIFDWPGIGREVYGAILARDTPLLFGGVLFLAVVYVLVNLVVDIYYGVLDPRLREARGA